MSDLPVIQHLHRLQKAVLAAILHADYGNEADPCYAAQAERDVDRICLVARDLVDEVNRLPDHRRPVGWDRCSCPPFADQSDGLEAR